MVTEAELLLENIKSWNDIKAIYNKPDLLLGNGFSLQFSSNFHYSSLFQIFLSNCDPTHQKLFNQFETTNFELIQKYLNFSKQVNNVLGISISEIDLALENLKEGLIRTIEVVHPRVEDINFEILENIAIQLEEFGDIFTTNYDLYLYHIVMKSNDISNLKKTDKNYRPNYRRYQDYHWGNRAPDGFNQFMGYQNKDYKSIYYLHGSLFLFHDGKLRKNGDELIDTISKQITYNNIPNFITEGSAKMKLDSIKLNSYLSFCREFLELSKKPILIFGNTLGEFDNHILHSIRIHPKTIIYCIYTGNDRPIIEIKKEQLHFQSLFNEYPKHNIEFVNASTVFNLI